MLSTLASLAILLLFPVYINAGDNDVTPNLAAQMRSANTWLDAAALPPDPKYTFEPGSVTNANCTTFPATCSRGLTVAPPNLGPCSMLPPHLHPRPDNAVVAMSGSTNTYMIQENSVRMATETLTPG
jgi:hypothetical protein